MQRKLPKQIRNVGNLDPCVLMKSLCLDVAVLRGSDKIEEGSGCPNPLPAMDKTSVYGLSQTIIYMYNREARDPDLQQSSYQ